MHTARVRFVNRVVPPAAGATGVYLAEMADALRTRGWDVDVTSAAPGEMPATLGRRALRSLTVASHLVAAAARPPHPDVLVLMTDPPMLGAAGPALARRTGAAVVHWVQDLYPDAAHALGALPQIALPVVRSVAGRAFRQAGAVVAIGSCMATRLAGYGVAPERLHVVPNWAPAGVRPDPDARAAFRAAHGLDGAFVVMYSGTMGRAHDLDPLIDAAEHLSRSAPQVRVVLVGDGPRRAWAAREVARRRLASTVRLLAPQPANALAGSLGAADLHVVTLQASMAGLAVPSKAYGAWAVGRPVVFVGPPESEVARQIGAHRVGSVVAAPSSGSRLAAEIQRWAEAPAARLAAGRRAEALDTSRDASADRFDAVLRGLHARRGVEGSLG